MTAVDGDLLAAASLLVGTAGLLYSTWHKEFREAEHVDVKVKTSERRPERDTVAEALFWRCLPLAIATWALIAIFTPPAISTIRALLGVDGADAARRYDPVPAAFLVAYLLMFLLATVTTRTGLRLIAKRRNLNGPDRLSKPKTHGDSV